MNPVTTGLVDGAHLLPQLGEVCGQDRRRDQNVIGHETFSSSGVEPMSQTPYPTRPLWTTAAANRYCRSRWLEAMPEETMIGTSWMREQGLRDALLVEEMRKRGLEQATWYAKRTGRAKAANQRWVDRHLTATVPLTRPGPTSQAPPRCPTRSAPRPRAGRRRRGDDRLRRNSSSSGWRSRTTTSLPSSVTRITGTPWTAGRRRDRGHGGLCEVRRNLHGTVQDTSATSWATRPWRTITARSRSSRSRCSTPLASASWDATAV